jgi:hypothetical protein
VLVGPGVTRMVIVIVIKRSVAGMANLHALLSVIVTRCGYSRWTNIGLGRSNARKYRDNTHEDSCHSQLR